MPKVIGTTTRAPRTEASTSAQTRMNRANVAGTVRLALRMRRAQRTVPMASTPTYSEEDENEAKGRTASPTRNAA